VVRAAPAVVLVALLLAGLPARGAAAPMTELIPSIGVTKSTDTNAPDAKAYAGLALRTTLLPVLKGEVGIAYRQDTFGPSDALKIHQWPITASLWLVPAPSLYVGGGVGWYRTTLDYSSALPIKDTTSDKLGVHLGGGVDLPLGPKLGLDLQGRYIFMKEDAKTLTVPTTFNPDFWTVTAGLAIGF
jgi:hypothetical protein